MAHQHIGEAIGAQLRRIGEGRYSVEFLDPDGTVRAVRPASPLEIRMWDLLCSLLATESKHL